MANIVLLGHDGWATNYKIVPSVASNNMTVALKTAAGDDPSVNSPITIRIGDAERIITSALSVTKNAGTNWCNAGSSELATQEVDYFVYLGYNATDGVTIGFSRIPYASLYGDFSTTTTDEKYCAISTITNAAAGDNYVNIGRFAATLSAGAGYTWSVPTFTSANLINQKTDQTRWLSWLPVVSCSGSLTYTSQSILYAKYTFDRRKMYMEFCSSGTLGGSASNTFVIPLPFSGVLAGSATPPLIGSGWASQPNGMCVTFLVDGTPDTANVYRYDLSNYNATGTCTVRFTGFMEV